MARSKRLALRKRWHQNRLRKISVGGTFQPLESLEGRSLFSAAPLQDLSAVADLDPSQLLDRLGIAAEDVGVLESRLTAVTTAGSDVPVYLPTVTYDDEVVLPTTAQSGPLINLPSFKNNPLFAGIDGSGFATVILDTGIDLDDPFFGPDLDFNGVADRIVFSYDFADNDSDASDFNNHGSNVSSIVASSDGTFPGVAPGADIIHLKVFKNDGSGNFGDIEEALQWVIANAAAYNIVSVNMSLGDDGNYNTAVTRYGIGDEMAALAAMNVIVVSAAGNDFAQFNSVQGVSYPAADPNSLAIGAVFDSNIGGVSYGGGATANSSGADVITPFSQRSGNLTDAFAPGAAITGASAGTGTVTMHGTSQASPHVAGAVVLMQQLAVQELGRRLTFAEVVNLLRTTGVVINDGDNENDNVTNTGLNFNRIDMPSLGLAILDMAPTGGGTAQIHGTVYNDLDADGTRDAGEPGLANWSVFLDDNNNGTRDAGEAVTFTSATGTYSFSGLAAGTYTVAEVIPAGWVQTSPGDGGAGFLQLVGQWSDAQPGSVTPSHEETPGGSGQYWGDVWGDGDYAYLGHYSADSKVDIVSLTNLEHLHVHTWVAPVGGLQFQDIQVHNGIGYFGSDNGGGTYIVDVTDPHNTVILSHISAAQGGHNQVHTLSVDGDFLYTADSRTPNVHVFNVANPAAPIYVRTITSPSGGPVHEITVKNGRMYTAVIDGTGHTDIFDVSNVAVAAPLLGTFVTGSSAHTAWPTDDGKYVAVARETGDGDVKIWDIQNLSNIVLVSTINAATFGLSAHTAHQPMIVGDRLYVSWYQAGVQAFDISDIANPVLLGSYDTYPGSTGGYAGNWGVYASADSEYILASDIDSGLYVFTTADARSHTVTLTNGQVVTGIDFGNEAPPIPQPPVLAAIGDQAVTNPTVDLVLQLSATDGNGDALTFSANAQSIEYHLDQTLSLGFDGNEYLNWGGRNEKWVTGANGSWYFITPDGKLYSWLGGYDISNDPFVEQVSTAAYANLSLLYNAPAGNGPAVVSVNGATLTVNTNDTFVGKYVVTVTVSDGQLTDSETIKITVSPAPTDVTAPTITARTPAPGATLITSSANIDVTFSETVTGVDASDLVLSGAGAASAVVAAPVNISGNTWRFAVTGLANGAVNVALAPDANDIEDASGNDLAASNWSYTVALPDTTAPTITARTPAPGATLITSSANIDVTFSETVTGVDASDFVLTGAGAASAVVAAPVNISGNTWRFAITGLANGAVNVTLAPDANDIEDAAGNDLAVSNWSYTVALPDTTAPTITARTPAPGATLVSSSANIDVTFSETVTGVDASDLVLSGAGAASAVVAAPVNISGNTWRFSVTGLANGAVNVTLAADANDIEDASGNDLAVSNWSYTVALPDTTAPTITARTPAPGATLVSSSASIDVTFSESVVSVDASDLVLSGAGAASAVVAAPVNISGNTWRFAVTGLADGAVNVTLAPDANDIEDAAGNDLAASNWSYTVALPDTTAPTITARTPAPGATLVSSTANIDVTFSETVTGVDASDFVLTGAGAASAVVAAPVNISGNTWRFSVTGLSNGAVNVTLAADANDIEDAAGNDLAVSNWSYTVALPDTTAPTITARTPAPGATLITSSANIDVTFSETVVSVDASDLVLSGAGAASAVVAAPVNISGNTWRFAVTGLANGAVNVTLAADANDIEDAAGNDVAVSNWSYTVALPDTTAPTITARTPAPGATLITSSANIDVTFSETVVSVDASDLVLSGAGAASAVVAAPVNISGNTWRFAITGLANGAVNVTLAPDANDIEDAAGNDVAVSNWSYTVALPDTTAPTITARTPAPGATLVSSSASIDVTFSESVVSVDASDLVLSGAGATSAVVAAPVNISGNTWRFAVTGLANGAVNVTLAADANDIEDAAGNDLAASNWSYTVALPDTTAPTITARTPAPGATLVSSSANIDVTFSETVTGVDASDLVLSGAGAASAVVAAPVNISGNTWRFAVTGLANGAVNVALAPDANDIEDASGNDLAVSNWSYTVALPDTTAPTITARTPAPGATLVSSTANIDVTFSETVTGVDASDFVLTGAGAASAVVAAPVNISGNTWRFAVTGLANGAVNVTLAPDANDIEDSAGNDLAVSNWSYTVALPDTTAPTITARTPAPGATLVSSSANIDVTFSETVTGVDASDLVLSGAGAASAVVAAPVNISGNTWRFAVTGLANGAVNVTLAPDANDIEDAAGNDLAVSNWSYTVALPDTTAPTITARTPAPGATLVSSSANIDVTFSETVTGVDASDLVLSGAGAASAVVAAPVNISGNTWRFAVTGLSNGAVNVTLAADANDIEDASGNDLAVSNWSYTVALPDTTAPTITARTPAPGATLVSSTANIDVTFSETVTGVDASDFVLTGAGAASAVVAAPVNISGNTWRFAITGLANGAVNVTLAPDANDIEDAAGNDLAVSNWSYTVALPDTTAPTITARTPAPGATLVSSSANIDVTFSETVTGVDASDLVLSGAGAASAVVAAPVNISSNTWRFSVTGLANGEVNVTLAPDANDIEDASGNDLAVSNWSYTVAIPIAQQPPVLDSIGNRTIAVSGNPLVVTLGATDPNNDPLTFTATTQSIEYHLDQALNLGTDGNDYLNWGGLNEKWMISASNVWYYIKPDGKVYRWLEQATMSNDPFVEQVSTAAYANTSLLHNAQANMSPAVVGVTGNALSINPQTGFTGKFVVTAGVSDGQGGTDSETFIVTVLASGADTTAPTITARTPAPGATLVGSSANIDVTFSETVTGVDASDFVLTGTGAAGAVVATPVNISGSTWRFAVTGLANGAVNVALAPDANDIEDASGNDLAVSNWSYTVALPDTTAPTITARTPAPGATLVSSSANIDVTFSETVTGVDASDLVLSGAGAASAVVAAPVNISGNTWRFAVTGLANGAVNVTLAPDANDIEDAAGNDLAVSNWSYTVALPDTTAPTITARTPAPGATLVSSSANIDVTFSETVTGVDASDLVLSGAGAASAIVAAPVNISGNTWRFAVTGLANGAVNVTLAPDANDIEDASGNDLAVNNWSYTVALPPPDTTPPTIVSQTPTNGATITGTSVNVDVSFNEAVTGVDPSDLRLLGGGAGSAVVASAFNIGGNTWRFVVNNLSQGTVNATLAPDANDIEDAAGNDLLPVLWSFNVTLPQPPTLAPIADQSMPTSQDTLALTLVASDPNNDPLTFSATAQSIEYHLDQTLLLGHDGDDYLNWGGRNEKWMISSTGTWYYVTPDGKLYRWLGNNDLSADPYVDQVSTAVYANTSLLWNAQPNNAPASLSIAGNVLTINPNAGFIGQFLVSATVNDGQGGTATRTFRVVVTA